MKNTLDYLTSTDPVLEKIATFFEGRVGTGFDKIRLGKIYEEGKNRYDNQVPPGYEDMKDKPEPGRYGDLVIWEQLIEFASASKKDLIYITDDVKKDWWYIIRGEKAGPRHELIREFKERTGQLFYAYISQKFIDLISSKYNIKDTESLREETKEVVDSISLETLYKDIRKRNSVIRNIIFRRAQGKCESCGSPFISENGKLKCVFERKNNHEDMSGDNGWVLCHICSDKISQNERESEIVTGISCSRCKQLTMGSGGAENICGNCGFVTDDY